MLQTQGYRWLTAGGPLDEMQHPLGPMPERAKRAERGELPHGCGLSFVHSDS